MIPGDVIYIDDGIYHNEMGGQRGFHVTIGVTGSYIIELDVGVTISSVRFGGSPDSIETNLGIV